MGYACGDSFCLGNTSAHASKCGFSWRDGILNSFVLYIVRYSSMEGESFMALESLEIVFRILVEVYW